MTSVKTGKAQLNRQEQTEAEQLVLVSHNAHAIRYMSNPSEAVQLAAVRRDGYAIQHIKTPSDAAQLAAVRQEGWAIRHIEAPSEAVQLAAVEQNGLAILRIQNPAEAVQLAAVKQTRHAIHHISAPPEAVQLAALTCGMAPGMVNTVMLLRHRDKFTTAVFNTIHPALCNALEIIDALGLTDGEAVTALDDVLTADAVGKNAEAMVLDSLGEVCV